MRCESISLIPTSTLQQAWIKQEKPEAMTDPYSATDGFDLYVDGCKNLPDSVTITRVSSTFSSAVVSYKEYVKKFL